MTTLSAVSLLLVLFLVYRALVEDDPEEPPLQSVSLDPVPIDQREHRTPREFAEHYFPHCPETARTLRELMERFVVGGTSWLHPSDSPWHPNLVGDSLGDVEFVMTVEDHFGVRFSDEESRKIATFADLVGVVHGKVSGRTLDS